MAFIQLGFSLDRRTDVRVNVALDKVGAYVELLALDDHVAHAAHEGRVGGGEGFEIVGPGVTAQEERTVRVSGTHARYAYSR